MVVKTVAFAGAFHGVAKSKTEPRTKALYYSAANDEFPETAGKILCPLKKTGNPLSPISLLTGIVENFEVPFGHSDKLKIQISLGLNSIISLNWST